MIILFVNAHKETEEGQNRFKIYHDSICSLLRSTVYYGNEIEEIVRRKEDLEDFLETEDRVDEKAKGKFHSVEYVFIDGEASVPPWAPSMNVIMLLIRTCMK